MLLAERGDQREHLTAFLEQREDELFFQLLVIILDELADQGRRLLERFPVAITGGSLKAASRAAS